MSQNSEFISESVYGVDCPYIDMQWERGKFFISNPVLRLLGNPGGIKFRWNCDKKILAIGATVLDDPDGYPVIGKNYSNFGSLSMGCITLISAIWKSMDWDRGLKYRIVARYNVPDNIAIFELDSAEGLEIIRNVRGGRQKRKVVNIENLNNDISK
ncbi:MAG: hypothetical protein FWE22_00870 [Firmicutes bacterium]|nr:hypothetical protein [Bacillota bacterium]